jgi:hypothetical protein
MSELQTTIFNGLTFTEADIIDTDRLEKMTESEAVRIFNSEEARFGRSLETIRERVRQSKIAELYMIENYKFEEADIMWHDLKSSDGEYTEVKAYKNIWDEYAPSVTRDLKRYRSVEKFQSKWYLLFSVDDGNIYRFVSKIKIK